MWGTLSAELLPALPSSPPSELSPSQCPTPSRRAFLGHPQHPGHPPLPVSPKRAPQKRTLWFHPLSLTGLRAPSSGCTWPAAVAPLWPSIGGDNRAGSRKGVCDPAHGRKEAGSSRLPFPWKPNIFLPTMSGSKAQNATASAKSPDQPSTGPSYPQGGSDKGDYPGRLAPSALHSPLVCASSPCWCPHWVPRVGGASPLGCWGVRGRSNSAGWLLRVTMTGSSVTLMLLHCIRS